MTANTSAVVFTEITGTRVEQLVGRSRGNVFFDNKLQYIR